MYPRQDKLLIKLLKMCLSAQQTKKLSQDVTNVFEVHSCVSHGTFVVFVYE